MGLMVHIEEQDQKCEMKTLDVSLKMDSEVVDGIKRVSENQSTSTSDVVKYLVLRAIEDIEDEYFAKEAAEIEANTTEWISHEEFWSTLKCIK